MSEIVRLYWCRAHGHTPFLCCPVCGLANDGPPVEFVPLPAVREAVRRVGPDYCDRPRRVADQVERKLRYPGRRKATA